jgi:hypothetical protein
VRQALQLLATDGLVSIKNGVGVTVTDLDRAEIDQAYYLRCQLAAMIGGNTASSALTAAHIEPTWNPLPARCQGALLKQGAAHAAQRVLRAVRALPQPRQQCHRLAACCGDFIEDPLSPDRSFLVRLDGARPICAPR